MGSVGWLSSLLKISFDLAVPADWFAYPDHSACRKDWMRTKNDEEWAIADWNKVNHIVVWWIALANYTSDQCESSETGLQQDLLLGRILELA